MNEVDQKTQLGKRGLTGKNPNSHLPHTKERKKAASERTKMQWKSGMRKGGHKLTAEQRKNISQGHKGINTWMKGRKASEESRKNISQGLKKAYLEGKRSNWKNGISKINKTERNIIMQTVEYKLWRDSVFARDGYTCQKTGQFGGDLVAHHILNFSSHPELRFAINNGITLSKKAHREFHKKYGYKNNTRQQLEEFLSNK